VQAQGRASLAPVSPLCGVGYFACSPPKYMDEFHRVSVELHFKWCFFLIIFLYFYILLYIFKLKKTLKNNHATFANTTKISFVRTLPKETFFYSTISLLTFCILVSNIPLSLPLPPSLFLAQYGFGFDHL
jgi:hypothetical protein